MTHTSSRAQGKHSEEKAKIFLVEQGLSLVAENFSCRFGEIDLIMSHKDTLVFVEVKHRNSSLFGGAICSVPVSKQKKIILTAQCFLSELKKLPPCRFDVVAIEKQAVNWYQAAFSDFSF